VDHWLSNDIVGFRIEVGVEQEMYENVTVNTRKMAIATMPAASLQRMMPLS